MPVQLRAYKIACECPSSGLRCGIRPDSSLPIPQPIFRRPMPYCGASYKVGKLPDPHTSKRLRIKASPHFPHKSGLSRYKAHLRGIQETVRRGVAYEIRTAFPWWMRYRSIAGINLRLQMFLTSQNSTVFPINATIFAGNNFRQIQSNTSNTLSCPYTRKVPVYCPDNIFCITIRTIQTAPNIWSV